MITLIYGERTARSRSGHALEARLQELAPDVDGQVNWSGAPGPGDEKVLNACSYTDKLRQLNELADSGVLVPVYTIDPEEPRLLNRNVEWLPRRRFHQQGFDFTRRRPFVADYYVKRYFFPDEWRIHVFDAPRADRYVVIRSGIKLPKPGHHPWIKSNRLGWKISYTGGAPVAAKEAAKAAMDALDLDFGCVDIGITERGEAFVLEVNTCPGIEGNTLEMYAQRIIKLLR